MFSRRCGALSYVVLAILAFLVCAPFALPQAVTIVHSSARSAGTSAAGYNGDSGPATTVNLSNPSYIVFDSNGNQFVSDTLNNCVRKIDTAGNITTVAGLTVAGQSDTCNSSINSTPATAQGLYQPTGLAIDSTNRLYIADSGHNCVRALASGDTGAANLTTVVGTCSLVPTASVTPAPNGLAIDAANNLYISLQDSIGATPVNQVVLHAAGATASSVCLVAGAASTNVTTTCAGITNGIALVRPSGLAMDVSGDLYIADTGNNCVRKIAAGNSGPATQSTAVGQCINDASGNATTAVHNPYGLAISPTQSLFISESNPDNIVSYVPGSNTIQIIGGLPSGVAGPYDGTQDGKSALNTPLNGARGIVFDSAAHLFVADSLNNIVREISSDLHFSNTPVGSPSTVQPITFVINQPVNLTSSTGTDYSITSTTCSGSLTPAAAGAAPNTCQIFVRFTPTLPGVRRSPLKITDSVSNTNIYQGLQGTGTGAFSIFTPGTQSTITSSLASPTSIVTDAAGNAYVLETATATPDIRFIPAGGGSASSFISNLTTPTAITMDAAGNTFVADATHGTVSRFGADGVVNASYVTGLDTPVALFVDSFNNLYIAQAGNSHNVILSYTSGARRVIAGNGIDLSADGVPATNARFSSPSAITMDLNGTLYIADQGGHRVYSVDRSGIIHIVAGTGAGTLYIADQTGNRFYYFDQNGVIHVDNGNDTTHAGQAIGTVLDAPSSLAIDAAGDLYIADQATGIIYAVSTTSSTSSNISVVLNTNAPPANNGPLNIALDGGSNLFIARNATNSVIELSHPNPTLDFGTIAVGNSSALKLQNITNVGTDNLNITAAFSTTDNHFTVDSGATTCGTIILTGAVCTLGFTFTPTVGTSYTASSIISSNSYNTPQSITLTGSGKPLTNPSFTLSPQVAVYGKSFAETVTFTNLTTAASGTITFTTNGQTLCTLSGTLTSTATCDAAASGLAAGSYTVTFNYSGDSNYNSAAGTVTLTVNPAPLSEVVNNATRAVGAANPTFSGTLAGVASGDTILMAYSTTATISSPAGSYPITATLIPAGSTSLSNYSITSTPAALNVTQASGGFTVIANPPAPYTKSAGTTTFQVTVSATGAFAGPVALTCSGLPADAGCTFANPIVTLTAGGSVTTTLSITTTTTNARLLAPAGLPNHPANLAPLTIATMLPIELTSLGAFFAGLRRRKSLGSQKMRLLVLIVCTLGILGLTGCGVTPANFQTYTINITGTSLAFAAPSQTATVVVSISQQ